jgi:hypothetical protein
LTKKGKKEFDDNLDAVKRRNTDFNLAIVTPDLVDVAIKDLDQSGCQHIVDLKVDGILGQYTLVIPKITDAHFSDLVLFDKYLDSLITMKAGVPYAFEINEDPESSGLRFKVTLETNSLPKPSIKFQDGVLSSSSKEGNQWLKDDEIIPGATGDTFVPQEEAEYKVTVTSKGCHKVSEAFIFRITGTEHQDHGINLYPNPTRNSLFISGIQDDRVNYSIVTSSGKIVQNEIVSSRDANGLIEINVDTLKPGVYVVQLKARKTYYLRFVKQ